MCGRFVRYMDKAKYGQLLGVEDAPELGASYNVAPTQPVLAAVMEGGKRCAAVMRFGMVPFWSKDGKPSINARAETVTAKPTFKTAFRQRRCLIAADGYYEWSGTGKEKQPYYFQLKDGRPFVFAGLWDTCGDVTGCAIITTTPNELQGKFHDRMPVILSQDASNLWLAPAAQPDALQALLVPYPAEAMACYLVSRLVNSAQNNRPECIEPLR
jgi:putative SOS response-associated peptidase YedK